MKRKNKIEIAGVRVESYAAEGRSIAQMENGKVLFVENAVPGDVVDVRILKSKKSWAEGKVLRVVTPSEDRVVPFCQHFGVCGGCKWQMLPYPLQLKYKEQQVKDQLRRIGHLVLPELLPIKGCETDRLYRNKLEFTFSAQRYRTAEELSTADGAPFVDEPALGFHAPGLFDKVVPIYTCYLQKDPTNALLNTLRTIAQNEHYEHYNFKTHTGWLRNAVIRVSTTGEVLINIILQHEDETARVKLLEYIKDEIPEVTSLNYTINGKMNDSIYDLEVVCYHGSPYITEYLGDKQFKISPKSFFQTNTRQAVVLYDVVKEMAVLSGNELIYDLYCGTGSIGIYLSDKARKIVGVEAVEEAVSDARENARNNGLTNCDFYYGDVSTICNESFFKKEGFPDLVICDPPRAGLSEKLVAQLMTLRCEKIIYVSCNPATQARDLSTLCEIYDIEQVQPVDMFPQTHHIENVVLLRLKAIV